MHTVDLLQAARQAAEHCGIQIREDWLAGECAVCELRGRIVVFINPSARVSEKLGLVLEALRCRPLAADCPLSPPLRQLLGQQRSA
ncbi:MAG TPA: hypothetical protein VFE24_07225 [Pirellulales bacterium]|jgi:hypothetical protein|nr:hypothetical protein [Pirellulales bacterium]